MMPCSLRSWKGDKQVIAFLIRAFADEPITVVISHASSIVNVSMWGCHKNALAICCASELDIFIKFCTWQGRVPKLLGQKVLG